MNRTDRRKIEAEQFDPMTFKAMHVAYQSICDPVSAHSSRWCSMQRTAAVRPKYRMLRLNPTAALGSLQSSDSFSQMTGLSRLAAVRKARSPL